MCKREVSVMVEEHSQPQRSRTEKARGYREVPGSGALGKDFVGISSEKPGENPGRRKPKVS